MKDAQRNLLRAVDACAPPSELGPTELEQPPTETELEQHPIRVAEASAVSRAWRRVAIPGGVAERPQDAVVANVRAPSRCKNMRCFFLSFLTATHEYLVAT
jgi:hypothetical protein